MSEEAQEAPEYWFSMLSLSHLKYMSLTRWVLCSIDIKSMHGNLPSLQELHMENVALFNVPEIRLPK
jgi:hypothetical protein